MTSLGLKIRSRLLFFCLFLLGLSSSVRAQMIPTVCMEVSATSGATNYYARFGYFNPGSTTVFLPINSAGNFLTPTRSPAGEPDTFYIGNVPTSFVMALPLAQTETWHLSGSTVQVISSGYAGTQYQAGNPVPTLTPLCPVVLEPATLTYTAPGTYTNVFLAQVESGPAPNFVKLNALSASPDITLSNLTYVPTDPANPTGTPNPNSIYGTVTVYADTDPYTAQAIVGLLTGAVATDDTTVTIAYNGPPPAATFTVAVMQTPLNTANTTLSAALAYTGLQAPTGAVTFAVDSGSPVAATCTGVATPLSCTASVPTGSLVRGAHTITAALAADTIYPASTGTGELDVQATPVITWSPPTSLYENIPLGAAVLNATSNAPGTFFYSRASNGGSSALDTRTMLPRGSYTLLADFRPSDFTSYSETIVSVPLTVRVQTIVVLGSAGDLSAFYDNGAYAGQHSTGASPVAAVDVVGGIWAVTRAGTGLYHTNDLGFQLGTPAVSGISGATTLAIDGANHIFVANPGNIVVFDTTPAAINAGPIAGNGAFISPAAMAIDASGNVWLTSPSTNKLTEVLGIAAPVTTPLSVQVQQATPGTRP